MVHIAPFRALRYQGQDLAAVTSPPHDVIHPHERDAFLQEPHNICHVILPPGGDDKYAAADKTLRRWQKEGVLARDAEPAFYLYQARVPTEDGTRTMRGFFCRIALDADYDTIRRHEMTLPKKRSDRLSLLQATGVNAEPIWMLYRDERGWVDEVLWSNALEQLASFIDEDRIEHKLWLVDRAEAVQEIIAQFDDRTVVIADGHHRYATQLKHWAETGRDEDGSILVCMVRDTDPGLAIRPTNRLLVHWPFKDGHEAVRAAKGWKAKPLEGALDAATLRSHVTDARTLVVLTQAGAWRLQWQGDVPDQGRGRLDSLAVTMLHDHLLTPWGLDLENVEDNFRYSRDDEETVERVRSGEFPAAAFLAPEPVDAVLDVARDGHVMPQKATYFVPKLRSGLVLSPCDEPRPQAWDAGLTPGKADWSMPPLS